MYDASVLYIIEHVDSGMTKIGITADWFSRARALKLHQKTKLIGLFESEDPLQLEKELHAYVRNHRLPGSEYFYLTKEKQEQVLAKARETHTDKTDETGAFFQLTEKKTIDVTGAIHWSACDWLRLNRTSWRKAVYDICGHAGMGATDDEELMHKVAGEQIKQISDLIDDPWQLNSGSQRVATSICEELFRRCCLSLDKKLFKRHRIYYPERSIEFLLPRAIRENLFEHLEINPPLSQVEIFVEGKKIKEETLSVLLEKWADFRGDKYCDLAMSSLARKSRFEYYLSCLGPMTIE
jgi:hypothetical protein